MKGSTGCWTCRVRRKKCDCEKPVCDACTALHIPCHYDSDRPEWMDGGQKQEAMAAQLKSQVRETSHRRQRVPPSQHASTEPRSETPPAIELPIFKNGTFAPTPIAPADTLFLMFYLDHLLPFLFPFYRPIVLHRGGRAWLLELIISSPVVRQAILCQSSYYMSLIRVTTNVGWETVLARTKDAFGMLRHALEVISSSGIAEHLHGAIRIIAGIMQVQRFEIANLSFRNCRFHLDAAIALFQQIIHCFGNAGKPGSSETQFNAVFEALGPSPWTLPAQSGHIPSAEQAAFLFSTALLVLDDVIASTVLQERPRLYDHHRSLLGDGHESKPFVNLEGVIGCQNWALLAIAEVSALDAWKRQCKADGNLDVMELVRRASTTRENLFSHLTHIAPNPALNPKFLYGDVADLFSTIYSSPSHPSPEQAAVVTEIWAHSACLYLYVVVSGWQPASPDVRYHVGRIMELLTDHLSPRGLLRTVIWPFCVAGCLAEPDQEDQLRSLVEALHPPSIFGGVNKALEIMEHVWRNRGNVDVANQDLASCFRSHGDLVLLL